VTLDAPPLYRPSTRPSWTREQIADTNGDFHRHAGVPLDASAVWDKTTGTLIGYVWCVSRNGGEWWAAYSDRHGLTVTRFTSHGQALQELVLDERLCRERAAAAMVRHLKDNS
jgi:hypothetical protein